MPSKGPSSITLVGAGTIGLSFAALYLGHQDACLRVTICDTRPDLEGYVRSRLPGLLGHEDDAVLREWMSSGRLALEPDLPRAVSDADIIQEQGPENVEFKQKLWPAAEAHAKPSCLLWSSTSGITATVQSEAMADSSRLVVVHPFNPPHVMPLIEVVPSTSTSRRVIDETLHFWRSLGRKPVVVRKEVTGFVANRLAFALLREACHLVNEDVVDVAELDQIVEASMGPRWAEAGPFKSYARGGGDQGFPGLMRNIGSTVQACWDDMGMVNMGQDWEAKVASQIEDAYGRGGPSR